MHSTKAVVISVYVLICIIWGTTWLAIRVSLESLTPLYSASFRFLLAGLFIYLLMMMKGIKIQKDSLSIKLYILQGIFAFAIPFSLVYWAEQFVPSGLASVLFGVFPFFVALFSYLFIPDEHIGFYKVTGILFGFIGILIIFADDIGGDISLYLLGMFGVVASGIMQAAMAVVIKKHGHHLNSLSMNLIPMLMGAVVMLLFGLIYEDFLALRFDFTAVWTVVYLGFFGSVVTFTSYYWLMKRINIVILALMAFITPIVALIAGWLFYNEQLSLYDFIGCLFVLAGIFIANIKGIKRLNNEEIIKEPVL
ncbi:MAG: multidrug DMT transporter permease [Ignavibacteria bacterium CG2_30_36_16]|nr:MAG: multidrug DMT transporter permease [Ignavibacteria bacterium CG2_30_36_16]